ncbi:MAG: RagB/SusD family nutrient uptake outer membrane protein [Bacteroidales bacterium]|nr:RagB/SusD family nutrient uptake outer membrane protein [Bacteroidales bacterium]
MKLNIRTWLISISVVLVGATGCTDLDTYPEGESILQDQKEDIAKASPDRIAADLSGMFAYLGKQYCVFGSGRSRDDDFGYPAVCLSQDMNGPDVFSPDAGYNWFSTCSEYDDRSNTYANPYMRWSIFYTQAKMANDIIKSIPETVTDKTLLAYKGQAYAIRAFDYLSIAPYYQFKYKGNEDKPCVPIVTEDETIDVTNNPRATVRAVYELIMSDLNKAIALLDGYARTSKNEVDQKVAYGLRARANLYMENWLEAANDAEKALEGYEPASRNDVSKPAFNDAKASNWMWAIIISPANVPDAYPSWPAKISSFSGDSYTCAVGMYKVINNLLFNQIPTSDVRKGWWVDASLQSPNLAGVTWTYVDENSATVTLTGNEIPPAIIPDVKVAFLPYTNVKFAQYDYPENATNAGDCV